jgi:DNA-binding YbaB/EbfC family protein
VSSPRYEKMGGLDLEQMLAQARQTEQRLKEVQAKRAEMRVPGSSPDGMVEVTVDGTGRIVGVSVNPRALRLDSFSLAEAMLAAAQAAYVAYDEQAQQLMAEATGDSDLFQKIKSGEFDPYEYLKGFGLNVPEVRGQL